MIFHSKYGVDVADGPLKGLTARAVVVLDEKTRRCTPVVPEIKQEPNYDSALRVCRQLGRRTHEVPAAKQRRIRGCGNALFYSLDGLSAAFRHEDAFRRKCSWRCAGADRASHAGIRARAGRLWWKLLLVLIVELLNSAIEAVRPISPEDDAWRSREGHGERRRR